MASDRASCEVYDRRLVVSEEGDVEERGIFVVDIVDSDFEVVDGDVEAAVVSTTPAGAAGAAAAAASVVEGVVAVIETAVVAELMGRHTDVVASH